MSTTFQVDLSRLSSSELREEQERLLTAERCTSSDLEQLAVIEQILEQREENVKTKIKPWYWVAGGVALGFLLTGLSNKPYYQAQPQIAPNAVSIPSGSGATVINFDND